MYPDGTNEEAAQQFQGGGAAMAKNGGVVGAIGQVVSAGVNAYSQNQTNKANQKLAEYQYSKDLEMWNLNNAYNTPANQMLRLQQGGLNPNLVYGTGTVTGNTSGNYPKYNAPTVKYQSPIPDIPTMIGTYQDVKMKKQTLDNMQAQKDYTEQQTVNEGMKQLGYWTDSAEKNQRFTAKSAMGFKQLEKTQYEVTKEKLRQMQIDNDIRAKERSYYDVSKISGNPMLNKLLEGAMRLTFKR